MRELARGIHPAVLNHGLGPALESLASRSVVPTAVSCEAADGLGEPVELAAYFIACEALANIAKYAQVTRASVELSCRDGIAVSEIVDDGIGGADALAGSGLRGLADRVAALGGTLRVTSPPGAGTVVTAEIPTPRDHASRRARTTASTPVPDACRGRFSAATISQRRGSSAATAVSTEICT